MKEIQTLAGSAADHDFAYIVSHDVRGSTRALTELPNWIREDLDANDMVLPRNVSDSLEMLERHARRVDQMMIDLLSYSRAGRYNPPASVTLTEIMNTQTWQGRVPSSVQLEIGPVDGVIHMAREDVHTVIDGLLNNAVKHGRAEGGCVALSARVQGETVEIVVEDNGPGMAPAQLDKAFMPMTTGQRRDEVEGSGLGLAIVQKAVAAAGGRIFAGQSPRLGGLRVELHLPGVFD